MSAKLLLDELYDIRRRQKVLIESMRSRGTVVLTVFLLVLCVQVLAGFSWSRTNLNSYVQAHKNIILVPTDTLEISVNSRDTALTDLSYTKKSKIEFDKMSPKDFGSPGVFMRFFIPASELGQLPSSRNYGFQLPRWQYDIADVYINKSSYGKFVDGRSIYAYFKSSEISVHEGIEIVVYYTFREDNRALASLSPVEGIALATGPGLSRFRDAQYSQSAANQSDVGRLAVVVLAVFCLLLFLIIDGSPESLALSLVMAFETLATGFQRGWLSPSLLGPIADGYDEVLTHFSFLMADVCRLYFVTQLARIVSPKIWPWLGVGVALAIPYGIFMKIGLLMGWEWRSYIPLVRDLAINFGGSAICIVVLINIRDKKLPWRKAALSTAGIALAFAGTHTFLTFTDLSKFSRLTVLIFSFVQANSEYLYALSAFMNISTLENRVRHLTAEQVRAAEIERDLVLGDTIQKAYLISPAVPPFLKIHAHNEAAAYVSGDSYFLHWNAPNEELTFFLNDVTGHGVHAAMQAFASLVLARVTWQQADAQALDQRRRGDRRTQPHRLLVYEQTLSRALSETTGDFIAITGGLFNHQLGRLEVFRSNYSFPLVLTPNTPVLRDGQEAPDHWDVLTLVTKNRDIGTFDLMPGSFVILISDGYVTGSRDQADLTQVLKQKSGIFQIEDVAGAIEDWAKTKLAPKQDDRTLVVIQWLPSSIEYSGVLEARAAQGPLAS